jgi:hypothetical protein
MFVCFIFSISHHEYLHTHTHSGADITPAERTRFEAAFGRLQALVMHWSKYGDAPVMSRHVMRYASGTDKTSTPAVTKRASRSRANAVAAQDYVGSLVRGALVTDRRLRELDAAWPEAVASIVDRMANA